MVSLGEWPPAVSSGDATPGAWGAATAFASAVAWPEFPADKAWADTPVEWLPVASGQNEVQADAAPFGAGAACGAEWSPLVTCAGHAAKTGGGATVPGASPFEAQALEGANAATAEVVAPAVSFGEVAPRECAMMSTADARAPPAAFVEAPLHQRAMMATGRPNGPSASFVDVDSHESVTADIPEEAVPPAHVVQASATSFRAPHAALTRKAARLRQEVAQIALDLDSLAVEASRQATAADTCLSSVQGSAEDLVVQLAEARQSIGSASGLQIGGDPAALALRRTRLQDEVSAMERRVEEAAAGAAGASNGPSWAAAERERMAALEARLARAEAGRAAAEVRAEEAVRVCEARLAELRQARRDLEAESADAGGTAPPGLWRRRFETLVAAQTAIADRAVASASPDPGALLLEQALAAAASASRQAADGVGPAPPSSLIASAVRCVLGLAEAEQRRRGLLVDAWRRCQGDQPRAIAGGAGSVVPGDRAFSPSSAFDWDLDICRAPSGGKLGFSGHRTPPSTWVCGVGLGPQNASVGLGAAGLGSSRCDGHRARNLNAHQNR